MRTVLFIVYALLFSCGTLLAESPSPFWNVFEGVSGLPGSGKQVVLISGDEEYRSEEACTQLGKILAKRHGFTAIVLYAIDPKTGIIDPTVLDNIPGLENLDSADVCVIATRFRNLPDDQMAHFAAYLDAGKPIIGLRTATHAFNIPVDRKYSRFSFNAPVLSDQNALFPAGQGFGRAVLGETWIAHHGNHGKQGTRGVLDDNQKDNPILRGIADVFSPTDVYKVRLPLTGDSVPLVFGQVLDGLTPDCSAATDGKNDPLMPIAWTKTYSSPANPEKTGRVFTTTMGAAVDLNSEGFRRLLVNATYWSAGLENQIPERADVGFVGTYQPSWFGFARHVPGKRPADYR